MVDEPMKAMMVGSDEVELVTPRVIDGMLVGWYQRRVLDVWMESGRLDRCVEAIKGNYKARAIKRWLGSGWRPEYISEEMRRRGYGKNKVLCKFIADAEGEVRLDDGQRDSLKSVAKIIGVWNENAVNVNIGQTFDVRQGNGER